MKPKAKIGRLPGPKSLHQSRGLKRATTNGQQNFEDMKMNEWKVSEDENGVWNVRCCVCNEVSSAAGMPYMSGRWYHKGACYGTLFAPCENCGQKNMMVPINEQLYGEPLCNECYLKKHNLRVVTLKF
jgi:hypothetical protein